ncbi:MAG: hypothetical protein SCK28_09685 [Bacillota bacterium]|nr:hypothetical protein [Bacillota bacterium]
MLDLIKEGLKSGENLATLPFKAIREIAGESNKAISNIAEISEEVVAIPFRLAHQAIDTFAVDEEEHIEEQSQDNSESIEEDNLMTPDDRDTTA